MRAQALQSVELKPASCIFLFVHIQYKSVEIYLQLEQVIYELFSSVHAPRFSSPALYGLKPYFYLKEAMALS